MNKSDTLTNLSTAPLLQAPDTASATADSDDEAAGE